MRLKKQNITGKFSRHFFGKKKSAKISTMHFKDSGDYWDEHGPRGASNQAGIVKFKLYYWDEHGPRGASNQAGIVKFKLDL